MTTTVRYIAEPLIEVLLSCGALTDAFFKCQQKTQGLQANAQLCNMCRDWGSLQIEQAEYRVNCASHAISEPKPSCDAPTTHIIEMEQE
ncbi:hypothetical protein EV138_1121 [Kribbella voronezhensis]|uniref:Uncharacterized protein n=1 Tax=Kribbella voronezhensis TaxID=2512212 RepID=A0A4R7T8V1_9ACTN|nr:hypothetical protein EV138_1121 [Kribbella voronezhensis]